MHPSAEPLSTMAPVDRDLAQRTRPGHGIPLQSPDPGASGLMLMTTRRAAGIGLFALTIGVTPVQIRMRQRPDSFAVPYAGLELRLPPQLALLALMA